MKQETVQLVFEILIFLLALYIAFFKSYLQEKGKNLATKEDIEEITRKVETIKGELQFSTQLKFSLKNEERNTIIHCYERFSFWLTVLLDFSFVGCTTEEDTKILIQAKKNIDDAYFQFLLAQAKMDLFTTDTEITQHLHKAKLSTLDLSNFVLVKIKEYEMKLFNLAHAKATTPHDRVVDVYGKLLEEQLDFVQQFNFEKTEKYKLIAPLDATLQSIFYNKMAEIYKMQKDEL